MVSEPTATENSQLNSPSFNKDTYHRPEFKCLVVFVTSRPFSMVKGPTEKFG